MIIETLLVFGGGLAFIIDALAVDHQRIWDGHMNKSWYGLTRAWWKGAFVPRSIASIIADMIDSDNGCNTWTFGYNVLHNKALQVHLYFQEYGKMILRIQSREDKDIKVDISNHDDYLLRCAYADFKKRSIEIEKRKKEMSTSDLIDERITNGYAETIKMVEQKILKQEPDQENSFSALLSPQKTEVQKEFEERVEHMTSVRNNPPKDSFEAGVW